MPLNKKDGLAIGLFFIFVAAAIVFVICYKG